MAPRFLPSNISRSPRPSFGNDTSPLMVGQPAGFPTITGKAPKEGRRGHVSEEVGGSPSPTDGEDGLWDSR